MIPIIALGACLYCGSANNSSAAGGNTNCFHCGMCDFVQCFFRIKTEQEVDGRWIAEVIDEPGMLAYGATEQLAVEAVYAVLAKAKETK